MKTTLSKKDLRIIAIEKRNDLAKLGVTNSISSQIVAKIISSQDFIKAKNIALYFPIKNEIDITSITKIQNKTFYFPKCNNLNLEFCPYNGENSLEIGSYGIKEPNTKPINPEILDVIYVPALMANKNNYRLGYGKGYYDRFFKLNNLKAKKIIVLANDLITDDFIEDSFDIACDMIISEKC